MRLSKLSNKHWRNKLSEVSEAFVVLTRKVGSALDQVRETALIAHTLIMQAEPLVLNATETLFHVKKACHSFSSVSDSLGKIDAALTNLQAHVREQDKNAEKAALLNTLVAYTGTYRVEDGKWITKVEVAWNPEWVGTEQVRPYVVDGNQLKVLTPWRTMPNWADKGETRSIITFAKAK